MQDYFELIGLPRSFVVEREDLERAYFEAQKRYHPDKTANLPPAEQQKAKLLSMALNLAYEALLDPMKRAQHLLALEGQAREGDTVQDPELLMEVMEMQERLQNAESGAAMEAIADEVADLERAAEDEMGQAFERGDFVEANMLLMRMQYLQKFRKDMKRHQRKLVSRAYG